MSYDIKNKIPSLLKPGIYISGSDKELGLDTVDLEVFSIGSWQTDSLSSRYIVIDEASQGTFQLNQANIDDVVIPTAGGSLPTSQIETLFGFAYTEADESTSINITDKTDLLQQINTGSIVLPLIYDHSKKPNEYNITSPPVKIKFGIEHYDVSASNFANALSDDDSIVDFLLDQIDKVVYEDMVVTEEVIANTSLDVSFNQWTLRYPNLEGPQNFNGHDITIKYKFEMGSYTNPDDKAIGRPAVQFEILFNNGINANNLLRIMNKVLIFNNNKNRGSEYKITSIKPYSDYYPDETNDLQKNKIGGILLDKIFPFGPEGPAGRGVFGWEPSAGFNQWVNESDPASDLPPFDAVYDFNKFKNEYELGQDNEPPLPDLEELGAGTGDYSWTRPGVGNDMYLTPVSINNGQINAGDHDRFGRHQGLDDLKKSGMWDMYWRNPHGNPHAREDDDDVLFNGNGAIVKISGSNANDMMFGDPSDTVTVNSDIFPNPVTTLGQAEPSIKKIGGKFIFKNKGSSQDNNPGLHKFLPTWQSGLNLWKDSNKTDLNGATWYLHTGQWDSSFEPHGYINANMNLPHGYNLEAANRTGIPNHSSSGPTYGIRTVGGQADANTSQDHDLPTIQPNSNNPNVVRVNIKNDSKIQIYGREVLTDVPRSGVFRVIVLFNIITYQRPSTHELKLSVGVKTTGQAADLSPTRTTEPITDDKWSPLFDSPLAPYVLQQTAVGEHISSNLFTTTPSDSNDTDPTLNLDVVLEVDMKGFYKNSVGDTNQDSWASPGVGLSVSNRDYYRGCVVNIVGIELQPIDIALLSSAAEVAPVYKYKVLQWGDEKTLLTDEQLMNSFYLNFYNQDNPNIWDVKKYLDNFFNSAKYIKSDEALNLSEHIYNVPGIKSIKTIVFRTNSFLYSVDESKIITTNIMINDGLLLAQDFSIFGGSEFNFLPLKTKDIEEIERPLEAIIGGLDEDSKYNTSAEKIRKDDNFIQSDYLERVSARDYVRNFNNQLYGKSPGQLDLGIVRVFKRPKDIYDFIGGDKLEIISDGLDTLPVNSSATDIFINNDDCLIDINPENSGFLTIQNSAGMNDKAILIGDYKLNQPKDGPVSRDGNMRTPSIEKNKNKQAF